MTERRHALICATALASLVCLLLAPVAGASAKRIASTSAAVGLSTDDRGRLIYGEHVRGEIVRVVGDKRRVLTRLSVASNIEPGLLGLAADDTGNVWASYTTSQSGCPDPTRAASDPVFVNAICVWRFRPAGALLRPDKLIFSSGHPSAWRTHFGGGMRFGPDGALYLGVGDLGDNDSPSLGPDRSQDLGNSFGKILRLNPNATNRGATGNPKTCGNADNSALREITDDRIYACGFRNPYSFDFDLLGRMWVADVGDECDELNLVRPGVNFGWQAPRTDCAGSRAGRPHLKLRNSATPSGVAVPKSKAAGSARGDVFFGLFRDRVIKRYDFRNKELRTVPGTRGRAGWSLLATGHYLYMSDGDEIARLKLR
ncbi:MAG: PQQ-dependent sugar dehydrogenase [Thermoleophilaceae bacterium]|nr:PQQ-dependent sugar dehydrogenase [Thermoleophilaceae bacterium]